MKLKKKGQAYSHSVIYSWIFSYLLLTLLNAMLSGSVYVIARNAIDTEINRSNQLLLENIRDNLDAALKEIDNLSIDILSSPQIQSVSRMSPDDPLYQYNLYQAARNLKKTQADQFPQRHYYIYLGNSDRVLLPGAAYYSRLYYECYIAQGGISFEEWKEILSGTYYGSYLPLLHTSSSGRPPMELALLRTIPPVSAQDSAANVVIMIDFSGIQQYATDGQNLILLDQDNRIIAQSKPEMPFDTTLLPDMPGEHGIAVQEGKDAKEIISYTLSSNGQWRYIAVTPELVYWKKATFIRAIMLGESLLCMVGMGLLSAYFVRRNYNVLREVVLFVRRQFHIDAGRKGNEYLLIQQVLSSSLKEKQEAEIKLNRQAQALRTNFLISLLEGGGLARRPELEKELFGSQFPGKTFSVAIFHFEYIEPEYWSAGRAKEADPLVWCAADNVAEELLGQVCAVYSVPLEGRIVCLLCIDECWEHFQPRLSAQLEEILDLAQDKLHVQLRAAVDGPQARLEDVHQGYMQALSVLDYPAGQGGLRPVFYEEVLKAGPPRLLYPYDEERKLVNHLRLGNEREALETVGKLLDNLAARPRGLTPAIPFILASNLLQALDSGQEGRASCLERYSGLLSRLQRCQTLTEAKQPLEELILSVVHDRASTAGRSVSLLSGDIRQIIETQYTDPGLCITSIAAQLDKSPYYISKVFKQETGSSILDFINNRRICRAKELLLSTGETQESVAQMTGFSNIRTFQRIFKKVEGVPPGRLRSAPDTPSVEVPADPGL